MPPRGHNESSARKEIPKIRGAGIVRLALSLSFSVLGCPERIIRRQTCHRGFTILTKSLYKKERKKESPIARR